VNLPPEQRRIGMVFQDYALFPHLDVGANVAFGIHGLPRPSAIAVWPRCWSWWAWGAPSGATPHELVGRAATARGAGAGAGAGPALLLLDEPFSNLDVDLRERLAHEVRAILKAAGATALFVTHDQLEAFAIGDAIGVMQDGHCTSGTTPTPSTTGRPPALWPTSSGTACSRRPPSASGGEVVVQTPLGELRDMAECPLPGAFPGAMRRAAARRRHRA
jgi:iron(III) transport system ATP-binding protein